MPDQREKEYTPGLTVRRADTDTWGWEDLVVYTQEGRPGTRLELGNEREVRAIYIPNWKQKDCQIATAIWASTGTPTMIIKMLMEEFRQYVRAFPLISSFGVPVATYNVRVTGEWFAWQPATTGARLEVLYDTTHCSWAHPRLVEYHCV
ncbi:hypothetical protein PISMIDRAFT_676219, partial [Pisolithus microcarpus 441]